MPRLSALLDLPKGSATLPLEWPCPERYCSLLLHKRKRGRSDPLFAAPRLKVRGVRVFAIRIKEDRIYPKALRSLWARFNCFE